MDKHPDVMELIAFARGELPEARKPKVAMHCRGCRVCGDQLSAVLLLRETHRRAQPSRWTANVLPAAAMLILLIGITFAWRSWFPSSPSVHAGVEAARFAVQELATSNPLPEVLFHVEHGREKLVLSNLSPLQAGLRAIVDQKYETAVQILTTYVERKPRDAKAAAYLGIALYLSGDDSDEVEHLLRLGEHSKTTWVQRWAGWYRANLFLRSGDLERASLQLQELAENQHAITGEFARALLHELARSAEGSDLSNGQR